MRLAGLFGHHMHVFMRAGERITSPFRLGALPGVRAGQPHDPAGV